MTQFDISTPDKIQLSEWKDADALKKVYNSPEYSAMPGKDKVRYEKHLYDTHIAPNFRVVSKTPPTFKEWMDFRTSDKFDNNLSKMYDYFDPRTSSTERFKDYGARIARSFTGLAENLFSIATLGSAKTAPEGSAAKDVYKWFEDTKTGLTKTIDKNSPVNASLTRRFFESLSDMSSDFAVWQALSEVTPALGQVTKVKGVPGIVTGALGKINLTQDLAQSKLGRFALNRLIGAAEGMAYVGVQQPKDVKSNIATVALLPRSGNPEIKKLLASQLTLMGPKATMALLHAGMEGTGQEAKDILVGKLTKANHEIFNKVARDNGYSMYNVAPKEAKAKIVAYVHSQVAEVMQSPLAHSDPELQKFLVGQHLSKEMTPEMQAGFKQSMEMQAKNGQKPSIDGLVQEEVKKAQHDAMSVGAAGAKSPVFKENLLKSDMRLEGDINKYTYALGHYMQKSPNSPYVKHMLSELSERLPNLTKEELKKFPAALQQHMKDLKDTGHTSPEDVRGVFRSTNLDSILGKGNPTEFQDELAEEVEEVQKIRKKK